VGFAHVIEKKPCASNFGFAKDGQGGSPRPLSEKEKERKPWPATFNHQMGRVSVVT